MDARRVLFVSLLVLVLALAGYAAWRRAGAKQPGAGAERPEGKQIVLVGSGATFPLPQVEKWISVYGGAHPNVKIEYTGKGSGGGQNDFERGLVDFACSDPPLGEDLWS